MRSLFHLSFRRAAALTAVLMALLASLPAAATTYVMTTDDELLDRARVVVLARVSDSQSAPIAGKPRTDYTIEIERLIKGFVPASTLLVRTLGGVRPDGAGLYVHGMPSFTPGERVLLFLNPAADGAYRFVEMGLGAFQELTLPGRSLAVRSLVGSHSLEVPGDPRAAERRRSHQPRDLDRFADWLADRAAGTMRAVDYFAQLPQNGLFSVDSGFELIRSDPFCSPALPLRWPVFDQGGKLIYVVNSGGQPGVPGGGSSEIRKGMNVWENDPGSNVDLTFGGSTSNSSVSAVDGIHPYVFEDPEDDIDGSFTSGGGGTVAINLVLFDCRFSHRYANGRAQDIIETGTVTQDGTGANLWGNSAFSPQLLFAEVMAHETGHSLGLAHSGNSSALMHPFIHDDGRGASLTTDDRRGIQFLYPQSSPSPPIPPSDLVASALSMSEIAVSWTDNSPDETSFELQEGDLVSDFQTIMTVPANTTQVTITGLPEATYRRYRVRAVNDEGESDFSEEADATTDMPAGTCVADNRTLCLSNDRFGATVAWETDQGTSGEGDAVDLTPDTGYFTFFNADNVEVVVKVLDACGFADRFWVFAGGLTNVRTALQVVDYGSGKVKTYVNPLKTPFQPIQDVSAFATCP